MAIADRVDDPRHEDTADVAATVAVRNAWPDWSNTCTWDPTACPDELCRKLSDTAAVAGAYAWLCSTQALSEDRTGFAPLLLEVVFHEFGKSLDLRFSV